MRPMLGRREVLISLASMLGGLAPRTHAQTQALSPGPMRRIGMLGDSVRQRAAIELMPEFKTAFSELGWVEGKNVVFEYRWAEQHYERFESLAQELLALHVDLIIATAGVTSALAAKRATSSIPILAVGIADPVKVGLVDSMARPGANVTGLMAPLPEWGKYIELARDSVQGATRIAVIGNPANVVYPDYAAQNEAAARSLGLKLQMIPVASAEQLQPAFDAMQRSHADVLVFGPDPLYIKNMAEIFDRARTLRLPVVASILPAIDLGALISYGADLRPVFRRAAVYADSILRGVKPADLPIEQPTRYRLAVNLKVAKALGVVVPRELLLRADEVIE